MAITNSVVKSREQADGATTDFTFSWLVYSTSELVVYKIVRATNVKTLQVLGVDYTVTLSGVGGTVSYTVDPLATEDSYIAINIIAAQAVTLQTAGVFRADSVEFMSDKITLLIEQLQEVLDRCAKVPREFDNPPSLPDFDTTAGYLYYDGAGTLSLATP